MMRLSLWTGARLVLLVLLGVGLGWPRIAAVAKVARETTALHGEERVNGNLSEVYAHGLDLISQRDVPSGTTLYFGYDGLGST
ncbi:MAG: hypothetical protein NZM29_04505, partial [Nitrospira sp.]|nr:hypothetical protein [Nitrospira sp.]